MRTLVRSTGYAFVINSSSVYQRCFSLSDSIFGVLERKPTAVIEELLSKTQLAEFDSCKTG